MKRKLYANAKWFSAIFTLCIAVITVGMLVLRLSAFRDMAAEPQVDIQTNSGNYLAYSLNRQVYFSSPTSGGNFLIESSGDNQCYMDVTVYDSGGDRLLYTGMLEPGDSRNNLPLDTELDEGRYECEAVITAYSLEDGAVLDQESHVVTLYIGEKPTGESAEVE